MPSSVNASSVEKVEKKTVLATVTGQRASVGLKEYLTKNNVPVNSSDKISLIDNGNLILQVIKQLSPTEYTVYAITGYDETSNGMVKSNVPFKVSRARSSPSITESFYDNTITFTASVTYNFHSLTIDGYDRAGFQPVSTSFSYTRSSSADVSITDIDTTFVTRGAYYNLTTERVTNDDYSYSIVNNVSNPSASRTYTKTKSMNSGYCIIYASGGDDEGPRLNYVISFSNGKYATGDGINMAY